MEKNKFNSGDRVRVTPIVSNYVSVESLYPKGSEFTVSFFEKQDAILENPSGYIYFFEGYEQGDGCYETELELVEKSFSDWNPCNENSIVLALEKELEILRGIRSKQIEDGELKEKIVLEDIDKLKDLIQVLKKKKEASA